MKHFPHIFMDVIDHQNQRYETLGDYYKYGNGWAVVASKSNADMEFLILVHELIELYLTQKKGIPEPKILKFDKKFEKERLEKKWDDEEPGDDPRAPYFFEHQFATQIEKEVAEELGIDWNEYEDICNKMKKRLDKKR